MGDARKDALRVKFDSRIKLEFHGATVTSVVSWPRSNGTKASCSPGSASSSRTCLGSASGLFGFTIKEGRRNSGFAKGKMR